VRGVRELRTAQVYAQERRACVALLAEWCFADPDCVAACTPAKGSAPKTLP
jgi:hypothetical protein